MAKKLVDVCFSPEMIHLYDLSGKTVVVVDILRATSCMTAGIANGISRIHPVAKLDECLAMRDQGYFIAGERNGQKVEGFDLGNSPYDYMNADLKGKKVAVTTTNGTVAIEKSKSADDVIIGAFLNLDAVSNYLKEQRNDVVIFCAGWKGKFNLEDSLFAGALTKSISDTHEPSCDAPLAAMSLFHDGQSDLKAYLSNSSHVRRLGRLNISKDIDYCLQQSIFEEIPRLKGDELINSSDF